MVKNSIKKWLMGHPKVLWLLFLVASAASDKVPDVTTKSGASGFDGP